MSGDFSMRVRISCSAAAASPSSNATLPRLKRAGTLFGKQLDLLGVGRAGLGQPALLLVRQPEVEVRERELRVLVDDGVELALGLGEVAEVDEATARLRRLRVSLGWISTAFSSSGSAAAWSPLSM